MNGNFEDATLKIKLIKSLIKDSSVLSINGITKEIPKCKMFLKSLGLEEGQLNISFPNNWGAVIGRDLSTKQKKGNHCYIADSRIGILNDGKVTLCGCLDVNGELIIGDINKNSIKEIRGGELFTEYKNRLGNGNISSLLCSRCDSLKTVN